jgi:hypothetical protein
MNITRGSGDDSPAATSFLKALKPGQSGEILPNVRVLTTSVMWADGIINPIRYNSSNPTNNPASYDLWVDVIIGDKTNRVSNWSEQPQVVN